MSNVLVEKQFFAIDSRHGMVVEGGEGTNSHLTFSLPNFIQPRHDVYVKKLGIESAVFACSYNNVNFYNNRIVFYDEFEDQVYDLQIPQGNYSLRELVTQLASMYRQWSISYSEITGQLTIVAGHLLVLQEQTTAWGILGLKEGNLIQFQPGIDYRCPYPANLLGTTRIVVRAPNIPCPNLDSNNMPFLLSLVANAAPFEQVVYENQKGDACLLPIEFTADFLEVEVVDDGNHPIDFRSIPWTMTLFIEYSTRMPDDERIASMTDILKQYEIQVTNAIEEQQMKKRKHKHHHYNTRHGGQKKAEGR